MLKKIFIILLIFGAASFALFSCWPHPVDLSDQPQAYSVVQPPGKSGIFTDSPPIPKETAEPEPEQAVEIQSAQKIPVAADFAVPTDVETATSGTAKAACGKTILHKVPFTPQAPFGGWQDERQQDGCEEAVSLMAYYWAMGETLTRDQALKEIIAISDYEQEEYGNYHDTAVADTVERIFYGYFKYSKATAEYDIDSERIIAELAKGNLVIIPTNGRLLKNPYYTPPGPERHNLVIIGHDPDRKEFIANDPGTKRGQSYRYQAETVISAIVDYPTGNHLPIESKRKAMIVVSK